MAAAPSKHAERTTELLADIQAQANVGDLGGFSNTITKCLAPPKVIHEIAESSDFWHSAKMLVDGISADKEGTIALALAELGRLQASLKSASDTLRPMAAELLARKTPSHFCHGDADQTTFAAKGWVCSARPVDLHVALRTISMSEAPKPLLPWLELALSAGDVSSVIEGLASCLVELAETDAKPSGRRANRLQRILKALRSALDPDRVTLDDRIANALADFVAKAFRGVQLRPPYAAAAKTVNELMYLVLHLIRADLRLLTMPTIYNSVRQAKGWLPDGGWRRFTKSEDGAAKLRKILLAGLVILLKQHNPNRALLESHRMLSPDRSAALAELKAAAQADRMIPQDERSWLASGGETALAPSERELTETDEVVIGMALLAVEALARCELFSSDGALDGPVAELVDRAREARNRVLSLAERRDLRVFGAPGEVVQFSQQLHQPIGADTTLSDVVIVEPGVESLGAFGARVVVPAIVRAS